MTTATQQLPILAFPDRRSAEISLADALAASVTAAHGEGRRARIALSGGSSPAPAYARFASMDLDWSRIDIALVDDRWVDANCAGSNEAMIRTAFGPATGVTIIGMKTQDETPFAAEAGLDPVYAALRPFDSVVLGMGADAHTASWFSGSPQLANCLSPDGSATVLGVDASTAPVAAQFPLRMTLTLPAIAQCDQVIVLLFGDEKKQVLIEALDAPAMKAPIKAVVEACDDRCIVFWAA